MVIEAFWPSCSGSLPDLWTVQPVLQGWMAADWVEVPMAADGTLIWPFLGEILAHDGLRGWSAASPHPLGGGVSQRTAQPMVVTPKSFSDVPRFWTLPLPSTNRNGIWSGSPGSKGARMVTEVQRLAPGTSKESHTEYPISSVFLSFVFSMDRFPPTPYLGKGEMDTYLVVVSFEF